MRCRRNAALREVGIAMGILSCRGFLKFVGMFILITCTPVALATYYWLYPDLQQWWFVSGSGLIVSNIWAYFMPFMLTQSLKRKPTIDDLDEHPRAKKAINGVMHVVLVCLVTAFIEYFYSKYQNTALSLVELLVAVSGLTSLFRRLQINLASFVLGIIMKLYKINPRRWKQGGGRTVVIFQTPELCGASGSVEMRRMGSTHFSGLGAAMAMPPSASTGDLAKLAKHTSIEFLEGPPDANGYRV